MSYSIRQNPAANSNYTDGRDGATINKIVIHHAATTDFDGIGRTFQNASRGTSAHYGVGANNNVDQYVQEGNIAWHAGNWEANRTSIGIENVNSTGWPEWGIADSTFATLVELVHDIAERHGLLPLKVGSNLFGHKDFRSTACPGQLYSRLQELADKVNGTGGSGDVTPSNPSNSPDQILTVGSRIVFDKVYTADDLQKINGIWQVRTNELCPVDFTWNDNGIPVEPITETDASGRATADQVMTKGTHYKLNGTYTVLNLGSYKGRWLAQIQSGVWRWWVDVETAREV